MAELRIRTSLSIKGQIEKKRISEHLMQAAAVYFVLLAVFSAYFSVFDMGIHVSQLMLALGGSALFLLLLMWNRKQQIKVLSIGAILLIIAGAILHKSLYGGIVSYINKFIGLYNQYYDTPKATMVADSTEYSSIMALSFLGVVIGGLLFFILDRKKGLLLAILVIALPVILAAVVGKMPLTRNWWILITATCFYLIVYRQYGQTLPLQGLSIAAGVLVGVIILSTMIQPMIIDYKNLHLEEYKQIRKVFIDSQETSRGDWQDTISNLKNSSDNFAGVSKGKLSKNASVNPTGEVAMEIVMSDMPVDTLYLKAYVASEYTGDSWEEISARELSEVLPSIGGSEKRRELLNEPFRRISEGNYVTSANPPTVQEITIELVNASKEFGYAPYCAEITERYDVHKDSYVEGGLSKRREYTFYDRASRGGWYGEYLYGYFDQYVLHSSYYGIGEDALDYYELSMADKSDSWTSYQEFVKEAYVDRHTELKLLRQYCDDINQDNTAGELRNLFSSGYYYSKNPGEMPSDMDFAEGFMFGRQVGFCVHFATAATLVYQMCGYPARYVEGYAVSPSDFSRYEDGTYRATVTDESAHAWCEVFDNEIGWIVKEFTPSSSGDIVIPENNYEQMPKDDWEVDEDLQEENPQIPENSENNPQEDEGNVDKSKETHPQGGLFGDTSNENKVTDEPGGKTVKYIVFRIVLIIGGMLIIVLAIVLQQKIRRAKRLKSFKQRKENKGVLSIYNAILELCVFAGFKTDKENEKEKNQELAKQFLQLKETEWNQIYLWAEMAAFSNQVIPKEEQKEMYRLYKRFRIEILKTLSFKKRIWLLYVRAL